MTSYLALQTKLDKTVKRDRKFHLHTVNGEEGICRDFIYKLRISCPERLTQKETEKLIGWPVTVSIGYIDKKGEVGYRFINGIVYELMELGMSRDPLIPQIWTYELEISSWLRKLDHVKDCRIIQKNDNTSAKIVSDLLRELGFWDFKFELDRKLPRRDYSVMFDETISNYIKRIIQDDGLIWYFRHTRSNHELVFSDNALGLPEIPDLSYGKYEGVKSFCRESIHMPIHTCILGSYEYDNPPVKTVQRVLQKKAVLNHYRYPGRFTTREDGEKKVECLKQGLQSQITRFFGESTIRSLTAGHQFKLDAPVLSDLHQRKYVIKELKIKASREKYTNEFVALQAKDSYVSLDEENVLKPARIGSQTAVVVGEKGAAEVPRTYRGRVKVRFHWDHYSAADAGNTSAYVRVSSPAAGSGKGAVFTPRIGEEVVVTFEDGDPEKPIIMGGVYSRRNSSPNRKEDGKSTPLAQPFAGIIKSDGDSDSNRLTFNDQSGSEYVEINSKKDLNFKIGHDLTIEVDEDIYIFVNNNESIEIAENINTKAGGSIINGTTGPICETAGKDKLNMALGGVFNIAGGVISNKAGATMTNTAILSVDNTSGGVLAQLAGVILANTAAGGISCSSEVISQKGDMVVLNLSLANIINSASKEIKTKTLLHKSTVDEKSITDTGDYKIKALMPKIN